MLNADVQKIYIIKIKRGPENSGIGSRALDFIHVFKQSS